MYLSILLYTYLRYLYCVTSIKLITDTVYGGIYKLLWRAISTTTLRHFKHCRTFKNCRYRYIRITTSYLSS